MNDKTILVEIGTEDMPSNMIKKIAKNFYQNVQCELKKYSIFFNHAQLFYTPRRIAIQIKKIKISSTKKVIKKKGPAIKNAFDHQGQLTLAAAKWMEKFNIHINNVKTFKNNKGEWLLYESYSKKKNIKDIIPKIIQSSIEKISDSKIMLWNEKKIKFLRPIRNITILINQKSIISNIFGITSNRYVFGNISTIPKKIKIHHAKEYEKLLIHNGQVIPNFHERKNIIQEKAQNIIQNINGKLNISHNLLEEIACLVEWPIVLHGKFKKKFLSIPKKILIYILESIQKYLPVYNKNNQLTNHFLIIANIECSNPNQIIKGNERVLHAKLSDINFFLHNDKKKTLESYLPLLKNIIFQKKLGSMYDKTKRLIKLIQYISKYVTINIQDSIRVAYLSKCDLKTQMVYEFPELQGIVGMYYALNNNEPKHIAISLKEQYQPKFSTDLIPSNLIGCILSITDKIDTIVGLFIINQQPTKNKDPLQIRRSSIGIIKIILKKKININLLKLIQKSIHLYHINTQNNIENKIMKFIFNRIYTWYHKKQYNTNIIQSVLSHKINNIFDIHLRIRALQKFKNHIHFNTLFITYKRIYNLINTITIQSNKKNIISLKIINNLKEKKIFIQTNNIIKILHAYIAKQKYKKSLKILFILSKITNNLLNTISIKYDNDQLKNNRIQLLIEIKNTFLKITNFLILQPTIDNSK
ncbi:glycine--tRNA ligase subunit beta [Buchnera aphidicola]|uniref:Glycine--tRNA ligase beta subunit n=1 Tax=Buchnera aphidicola (Stegophylla sp.) TaxID=2315800 RepID=A0A4D6YA43_9GAMM|nr:glycine--tRNA ligase subunit beta [Buchnera aphidicola (Stegophylla sp.)]QCI26279.1 glycine--tRNA ligase subunit beta [Buchnera aphidicola (Stegophylla sp.)]